MAVVRILCALTLSLLLPAPRAAADEALAPTPREPVRTEVPDSRLAPPFVCVVEGFDEVSSLCPTPAGCPLASDLRVACRGADLAFAPRRAGVHVLFSPPSRSLPRWLVTVEARGARWTGPIPWAGQAGTLAVDGQGQAHAFLYGREPAGGVGYVVARDGEAWAETVDEGWPSYAADVAFAPDGTLGVLLAHPVERGPVVLATRASDGSWTRTSLAPTHEGLPGLTVDGSRWWAALLRPDATRARVALELCAEGKPPRTLLTRRFREPDAQLRVRAAAAPGAADPRVVFPLGDRLFLTAPGTEAAPLGRLVHEVGSDCPAEGGRACPQEEGTCTRREAGLEAPSATLVRTAAGALWLVATSVERRTTYGLRTLRATPMPVGSRRPPEYVECRASLQATDTVRTLVVWRVGKALTERLRVPLPPSTLLGVHAEGDDLVLGLAAPSGSFRSVTLSLGAR